MSYRPHPSKNKNLPPNWNGPLWWQIEIWPDGKKRENGKVISERLTGTFYGTEKEAQLHHADILKELRPYRNPANTNPKLADIYVDFLTWYRTEVTEGTINDFLVAWNHFGKFFSPHRLTMISNTIVQQYKNMRQAETFLPGRPKQRQEDDTKEQALRRRHPTRRTINRELCYLSSMLKWAGNQNPPLIEPGSVHIKLYPKKQTQRAEPILTHTFEEANRFLAAIGDTTRYDRNTCNTGLHKQMALDRYGLVLLMYDAGLRKKEALNIEAERVSIPPKPIRYKTGETDYGSITIIRKGGRAQTLPILTERLYRELQARLKTIKGRGGYLYVNPKTKRPYIDIREGVKTAGAVAGIHKKNNPHLFRHDFITHQHESGTDIKTISELAGHSVLSTTSEIYSHLTTNTARARSQGFTNRINNLQRGPKKKSK